MTGASIETTLELWASSLRDVKGQMRRLFTQERVAASANLDWMTEHYEPWLVKLGLIGEVRSSPLRRKPNARQLDAEHYKDLSGEQFGRGHTGLRPQ